MISGLKGGLFSLRPLKITNRKTVQNSAKADIVTLKALLIRRFYVYS